MFEFLLYGLFVIGYGIVAQGQGFPDPIANIRPVGRPQRERTNQQTNAWEDDAESQWVSEKSLANKRNADKNLLVDSSTLQNEQVVSEEEEGDENNLEAQCTYTFVVPQHCASATTQAGTSNIISELQQELVDTKSQINELKSELRKKEDGSSQASRDIESLQNNVNILQQESRNMDSRVSQLYTQLLHEIINKRDNSLEMRELQNKLLNHTVDYHKLKEDHDRLKQNYNELRHLINIQSQELDILRHQVQTRTSKKLVSALTFKPAATLKPVIEFLDGPRSTLPAPTTNLPAGPFRDCAAVQRSGYTRSGIFNLKLPGYDKKIRVWCDFEQDPGGWIVVQRRTGRRVNFYRNMAAYTKGFGRAHSDYWLGLEHLHWLTNQTGVNFKLHIDLEDWDGRKTFVEYRSFRVEGEDTGYRLRINHYSGTAGDSLTWHNNMSFSAMDVDNDTFTKSCARIHRGGWWYKNCAKANLNGVYYRGGNYLNHHQDGVYWSEWRGGSYSLKSAAMKIRPTDTVF